MALPPLPRGFRLVDDENEDGNGLPPLPSGYSDAPEPVVQAPRPARTPAVPSLDDLGSITGARDGDTFTTTSGTSVRGYGFDAPELKQQGWGRQGQAVPIGMDSQRALGDMLAKARSAIGGVRGQSYGRAVAPVSIGGQDAGLSMIRGGNALAAPGYMKADPARSFDYMQAERLARLNGLGLHDTFAQTPSDFRHNPQPSPDRETVARFWDTPTPFAGIRPEAEARVLEMTRDPNVPIVEIAEYAKANGAVLDLASAQASRDHFLKYGNDGGVAYRDTLRVLTDQGDGAVGAAGRGFGSGALAGGLDEVGALADTLGLTDGRENLWNSERRFADIWSNNQAQNSAILGFDEQAHPYAELGGELAGGLVAPFGAGAKTLPELARVGAAYGAASGFLGTDGGLGERAIAGAIGVPIGGVLGAGAGKALEIGAPIVGRALGRFARRAGDDAGALADDANSISRERDYLDLGEQPPLPRGYSFYEPSAPLDRTYPGPVPIADPLGTRARESYNRSIGTLWQLPADQLDDLYLRSKRAEAGQLRRAMDVIGVQPSKRIASNLDQDDFSWERVASMIEREASASGLKIPDDAERLLNPRWGDTPADGLPMSEDVDALRQAHTAGGDADEHMLASEVGWALRGLDADQIGRVIAGEGDAASQARMATVRLGYQRMAELGVPANEIPGRINDAMLANGVRPETAQELTQSALQALREGGRVRNGLAGPVQPVTPEMRDRDWINIDDLPPLPAGYRLADASGAGEPPLPEGYRFASMSMDAEPTPSISQEVPRQPDYLFPDQPTPMDQPLSEAQRRAMAARIDPRDLAPIPSNEIGSVEELAARDAGRFAPATAPNERGELTRQTVRSYNGAEVPKVGPIDMVGWLRLNGGLQDQAGELSHMGLNNAARRGVDFVGQEARFGPLVNEQGMRLDDAAHAAWEAGYFPDHMERPSVNEFLDALRSTHEGRARNFLPEDLPEVDRYYGAQQERYALEQQRFESNEPILRDRSMPADEPQPFAPPEAYEEWGAGGGPDFAGNIRLEKLQTPQDISRALSTIERRVGFDAATRGRVSQAETERLAAELNMTPDSLIARRQGQAFNAEEALAARQILAKSSNELVNAAKRIKGLDNPGDEMLADFQLKLSRHVAIQEQVSGMTAEAGRALQQFRQVADSSAVRKDVLSSLVQSGGGRDRLERAADLVLDAVESEPGKFNTLVDKLGKPRFRDKLTELYINNLLTSPATHAVNMVSNTITALGQIPEHAVASAIGGVRQAFNAEPVDRVLGSEVGARAFGLLQGAKEGARLFAQSVRTGEPSDIVSKVEGMGMKAISGLKGEVIRAPTRLLTAEDELFKGVARRMELNGQAVRQAYKEGLKGEAAKARIAELVSNPTDEMLAKSFDYARYVTFQSQLGPFASKVSGATQAWPALKLFLPFVRTPTNLLKFATERSPAAPFLREWRDDVAAGGARRDLALAKAAVGTGLGVAIYEAALAGKVTGSAPSDPAKARLLYADGWQPYSINIGDQYYSYKRLDPFSTTLGVAADLALLPEGMSERQREDKVTLFVASVLGNLASKTWLTGISDALGAITEPDRKADRMIQRLVGSVLVPTGVAQAARMADPIRRETETVGEYLQSRIPFASRSLMPKRDLWGREVESEGGVGPDVVSPIYTSTARNDAVNRALLGTGYAPGKVQRRDGMTAQQYDRYQELAGRYRHDALQQLVTSPAWRGLDADARESAAKKASEAGGKQARAELFGAPPRKRAKSGLIGSSSRASSQDVQALPAGYSPAPAPGEAMGVNVYRDIQQAIPGVRITSGFRTPEYQADMRRRGYRPAQNSAHLDGSALDLLPPPGKSMSWLRDRVRSFSKDAKLLNEGDHLHAIFPGYYGAPVLGGARGAGLKNPYEGMPPLPSGYKLVE